jgi:hypothetical protein
VEIEGPNGDHILLVVHFASVASPEVARPVATKVANEALDRISYYHGMVPGLPRFTGHDFNPLNPAPGVFNFIGGGMPLFVGGVDRVKAAQDRVLCQFGGTHQVAPAIGFCLGEIQQFAGAAGGVAPDQMVQRPEHRATERRLSHACPSCCA